MDPRRLLVACIVAVGVAACGAGKPIEPVDTAGALDTAGAQRHPVNVVVLNGPIPSGAGAYNSLFDSYPSRVVVTPNRLGLTIARIGFVEATTGTVVQTTPGCVATFSRSLPTFTTIGNCPVSVPSGSYDAIQLTFRRQVLLFLADTSSGYYTTPTGTIGAGPGKQGSQADYLVNMPPGYDTVAVIRLASRLVVDGTAAPTLSVVIDGHQSVVVGVNSSGNYVTVQMPVAFAIVGTPSSAEYYVRTQFPGAASFCAEYCNLYPGITAITVLYTGANTPVAVGLHYFPPIFGPPATCPQNTGPGLISDPRSYLGWEPVSSDYGWAVATDSSWKTYAGLLRLRRVTTIGSNTDLYCSSTTSVTAPPGGSFSSTSPDIRVPENIFATYRLVAK